MLSDRRDLHLVNLDLFFLGQVLQIKTLTCLNKSLILCHWKAKVERRAPRSS